MIDEKNKDREARTGRCVVYSQFSPKRKRPSLAPAPLGGTSPTTSIAVCLDRAPFLIPKKKLH